MKRKYLALIGVIIALSIIVVTLSFQLFIVNNSANAISKADSFEKQLKEDIGTNGGVTIINWNLISSTQQAEIEKQISFDDFTKVSKTTFLNDIRRGANILRVDNTFYLLTYNPTTSENIYVQYSPS